IKAIRREGDLKMPPDEPLKPEAVAALARWVKEGLPWPEPSSAPGAGGNSAAWKAHWAFQSIAVPSLPEVPENVRVSQPVDRFLLAKLHAKGLSFSSPVDRHTLIRRATFDL